MPYLQLCGHANGGGLFSAVSLSGLYSRYLLKSLDMDDYPDSEAAICSNRAIWMITWTQKPLFGEMKLQNGPISANNGSGVRE